MLKRQENLSWFVSVPHHQVTEAPTLQDALRLSMQPEWRERHCQHCRHNECLVTTSISHPPRTLILQLKRYIFRDNEPRKIGTNVGIPKFLSLNEYAADDDTQRPQWKCTQPSLHLLSGFDESKRFPGDAAEAGAEASSAAATTGLPLPTSPLPAAELTTLDADSEPRPPRTRAHEERELQEALMRSLDKYEPADPIEQTHPSKYSVDADQSHYSVDQAGENTYRLVGVVSHYGDSTHSGHYVSDVYSVGRDRWYHYDDQRVRCVDEANVLEDDANQSNGYIFMYLRQDMCRQVSNWEASLEIPSGADGVRRQGQDMIGRGDLRADSDRGRQHAAQPVKSASVKSKIRQMCR